MRRYLMAAAALTLFAAPAAMARSHHGGGHDRGPVAGVFGGGHGGNRHAGFRDDRRWGTPGYGYNSGVHDDRQRGDRHHRPRRHHGR